MINENINQLGVLLSRLHNQNTTEFRENWKYLNNEEGRYQQKQGLNQR